MQHFRLGTIRGGGAVFIVALLMLHGAALSYYLFLALVYAVPCMAAYKKSPAVFWRGFTLLSIFVTAPLAHYFSFLHLHDLDGEIMVGWPVSYHLHEAHVPGPALINLMLVSGIVMLPLGLLSTLDTMYKSRSRRQ